MSLLSWVKANAIVLATVVVLAALVYVATGLFGSGLSNPRITYHEAPLLKNKAFQLAPGEQYVYEYDSNGTSANITFATFPGDGCVGIAVLENQNATPDCVGSDGRDSGGFDSALSDPSMIIFKPWMLALSDGWTWNNSMYLSFDAGEKFISNTTYRVVRTDTYMNRTSFIVEIKSGSGPTEYEWVDADKRILLRSVGDGYEVRLVSGLPLSGG